MSKGKLLKAGVQAIFGEVQAELYRGETTDNNQNDNPQQQLIATVRDEELKKLLTNRQSAKKPIKTKSNGQAKETAKYKRFTTIMNREQIAKLKEIGLREGKSSKDLLEDFIAKGIAAYERKHGVVEPHVSFLHDAGLS